jgi:hypothetical protein
MSNEPNHANSTGHGSYEHRDIGIASVLYFLAGLAASILLVYFLADGVYAFLDKRIESEQPPVSPMATNAPTDTRHLSVDYRDYLKQNFPSPQLETDERTQLDSVRLNEAKTLNTYGWVDQKAGIVRIPIDRAMDLIAQRGLPVRQQGAPVETGTNPKRKGTQQ